MQYNCNYKGAGREKKGTSCNCPFFLLLEAEGKLKVRFEYGDTFNARDVYKQFHSSKLIRKKLLQKQLSINQVREKRDYKIVAAYYQVASA